MAMTILKRLWRALTRQAGAAPYLKVGSSYQTGDGRHGHEGEQRWIHTQH